MIEHTLVFTDVMDSTAMVQRVGDERALAIWAEHDRCARALLAEHKGREIDRSDGFFLLFDTVPDAARFALAYHRGLRDLGLAARVGVHVGRVALRHNTEADIARGAKRTEVEGIAKPFAARVMALARGGQTLLSADARAALGALLPEGAEVDSHGHYRLKGVDLPAEVFELGLTGCTFVPPADADKAYRVVRSGGLWQPLREVRHNLVAERDVFVGRGAELRDLARRLDTGARLVTVVGSGGTGKTRLVRRYAMAWLGDWPGGVYFCDLSEARSLEGILFAVAGALGVPLGKDNPVAQLGHAIAARARCLVVLDNFEQVLAHASATLGHWLDRAGDAAFVVTSRERLRMAGEELFPVEPLLLDTEAIELFEVRARAHRGDFALVAANRAAVAEVVRLLDGLPLAIELAAARVRVFSPSQLVERLRDRFRILAGARGTAARQATLKAAIDWSWELLTPWEQAALAQCSVFDGGFTLAAAEAVLDLGAWPEAPPAMDAVQSLVDKSLLRNWLRTEPSRFDIDEPYFGMYLSIHEYAAGKLDAGGGTAPLAVQRRHGNYFAGFGTDVAIETLYRHGGVKRRHALAIELDNLVAACRRAISRADGQVAVGTFRAAWEVLDLRGPFAAGTALGLQVLALDQIPQALRAVACVTLARATWRAGRSDEAIGWLAQASSLFEALGDRHGECVARFHRGGLQYQHGHVEEARALYNAALIMFREVGDRRGEANVLGNLGNMDGDQGRMAEALANYQLALGIQREIGNRGMEGSVLANLGSLHSDQGQLEEAWAYHQQALAVHREVGDRRAEGMVLSNIGVLYREQGREEEARAIYDQALALHREVGNRGMEGFVLGSLGNLHGTLGRMDEARAHYERALGIVREAGHRRLEGFVLSNLGLVHFAQGRIEEAGAHYEAALAIHREVGDRRSEGAVLGSVGDLLLVQGQLVEAREALRAGEALLREVGDRAELAKLRCIVGRVDVAEGEIDAARRSLEEAQAIALALGTGNTSELGQAIARLQALVERPASLLGPGALDP